MNVHSIRFRLTAWYTAVLTAVFVLLGAFLFVQVRAHLEGTLFESQIRRAEQIGETLIPNLGRIGRTHVAETIESLYAPELSGRFIRITGPDDEILYRSGPPNDQSFDPAQVPPTDPWPQRLTTRKSEAGGDSLLIAAVHVNATGGGSYLVEVGTSAAPVDTLMGRLALLLGLGLPVVLLVAACGGYLLVQRALRPVDQFARKAELISQHNLSERLPIARTGDELERLAVSLNHMITRLDDAFQNSKRFVADASHEVRTPLTILRGELEDLVQDTSFSAEQRERLGGLLEEIERLSKIVDRLFALSRLDSGEAQTEWVEFDLGASAECTAVEMKVLADDKKITIASVAEPAVRINGDRARIKQVIVNLLDNAIKYTPDGGAVGISASRVEQQAVLKVTDTGVGIPAGALPHVFERFYRVDPARSPQTGGAGLGLAIVKAICSAHGAEVEVESAIGRGTSFTVKFPFANPEKT